MDEQFESDDEIVIKK